MNKFLQVFLFFFISNSILLINAQSVLDRTPELEASKQTEKLQKELNLSESQSAKMYEINLKFARERRQTNNRKASLERVKRKNKEIEQILNKNQRELLQSKRIQTVEINGQQRSVSTNIHEGRREASRPVRFRESEQQQNRPVRSNFNGSRRDENNESVRSLIEKRDTDDSFNSETESESFQRSIRITPNRYERRRGASTVINRRK